MTGRPSLKAGALLAFGTAVTLAWLGACAYYVYLYIGIEAVAYLLPHEVGGLLAGGFAPVAFVWLLLAFLGRGDALRVTAGELREELRRLTFPNEKDGERVAEITAALKH